MQRKGFNNITYEEVKRFLQHQQLYKANNKRKKLTDPMNGAKHLNFKRAEIKCTNAQEIAQIE